MQTDTVTYANFRKATDYEVKEALGNAVYQRLIPGYSFVKNIFGTIGLFWQGVNIFDWKQSYLQILENRISYWRGYKEVNFMKTLTNFIFGNRYTFESQPKVFEAFFAHHRNDVIFEPPKSMGIVYQLAQQIFSEEEIHENDFMMTCDSEYTKMCRTLITMQLKGNKKEIIQKNAQILISEWGQRLQNEKKSINITKETHYFACMNATEILFGNDVFGEQKKEYIVKLAEHFDFINQYITKIAVRSDTEADKQTFKTIIKELKPIIERILKAETPLFENSELSLPRKKSLIFVLLFAGQETTASLLTYLIWQLALHPEQQETLYEELSTSSEGSLPENVERQRKTLERIFTNASREFTPAY